MRVVLWQDIPSCHLCLQLDLSFAPDFGGAWGGLTVEVGYTAIMCLPDQFTLRDPLPQADLWLPGFEIFFFSCIPMVV